MNTYRPLNEKFQNGPVSRKTPYYSPWFFGILRRAKFDKKALLQTMVCWRNVQEDPMNTYRPLNEMAQFREKPLTIAHGFSAF